MYQLCFCMTFIIRFASAGDGIALAPSDCPSIYELFLNKQKMNVYKTNQNQT